MDQELAASLMQYHGELASELEAILQFWMQHCVDERKGGFIGKLGHDNTIDPEAPKGAVLNCRILRTFAAAARQSGNHAYRSIADRAFAYLDRHFVDPEFGGVYWTVTADGKPLDTKKQIYALAFAVYAFSEYYKLTGEDRARQLAIGQYRAIEQYSFDAQYGGYLEALDRKWQPLADLRLSEKDANEKKSMNTHLHVLEGYTNLYRVWPDAGLRKQIIALIRIFLDHIMHPQTHHLVLFFSEQWQSRSSAVSFGHDIEAAWLVQEAAETVGEEALLAEVRHRCLLVADAAALGLDGDGGLWYEKNGAHWVREKHWWPQAEAMVGFFNAWQESGHIVHLQRSLAVWAFVKAHILDREKGEWAWGVRQDYSLMDSEDKAGLWKCPYHNGRACLELMQRIGKIDHLNHQHY
ncbi:mannobiose 2-epimerase [Cnuella takakiae]|uniref:Cellobiose 2-epimerase n=1 Tax=Cnuella takakiae TaxID=1302690 RepID=A0A1M5CDS8_9BACT|nr:AGE family epimerase/isomerase [Cnuella takakiae]OLY94723.1 N-acyl-D-glucosamine 2-epimerase [Cnuella takakiae]SHF52582.1 mannobiose 2-epimerase [Cnuella takakiae]